MEKHPGKGDFSYVVSEILSRKKREFVTDCFLDQMMC